MAKLKIKNKKEFIVTIDNFRTLARKTKEELLPPTVGYDAQNVRFDEELGSIEKRKNRSKYGNMATIGTERIIFGSRYYKNSDASKTLIISYDTTLKTGNDNTGAFTNLKTGLTAGLRCMALTFKDLWYWVNGTDANQVYDGTNINDMGIPIPDSPSTAQGAGAGLTGAYQYKVTYQIDDYQEGSVSDPSPARTVADKSITVTIPVSANTRVTARKIYRTLDGGSVYYLLTTISDNTTTTYADTTVDADLGTDLGPTDYDAPGTYKYLCLHKSRVFLGYNDTYKSRVIYSDIRSGLSYPDVFPAANYFDILRDNGEDVIGPFEDQFGNIIVFKPSAVIRINTDTDSPIGWTDFSKVLSISGPIAPYSVAKTPFGLIYISRYAQKKKRLVRWTGIGTEPVFEELEPIISAIPEDRLADAEGHYHNNEYHLTYSSADGNAYSDRVLKINLISGTWTIDKKNVDCFVSLNSGTDEGELLTGSSDATGFVMREDTDLSDLYIQTKTQIDLGTLTSNLTSGGTDAAPLLQLNSGVTDDVGAKVISTLIGASDKISDYDGVQDTISPSGIYTSKVYDAESKNIDAIFWNEQLGSYGDAIFFVRSGSSEAACLAASWSGPYSTPTGSTVGLTGRFVQFKCQLLVLGDNVANYADVYLERGSGATDYIVKLTFGYGKISETAIEMLYTSPWIDFSWISPLLKRVRKHMRQVRVDFERDTASGTLTFGYYKDGSSSRTDKDFALATYASKGYAIYKFPYNTFCKTFKYRLFHDDDAESLKISAVHFSFTVEPKTEIL